MKRTLLPLLALIAACDRPAPRPTGPVSLTVDSLEVIVQHDRFITELRDRDLTIRGVVGAATTAWGRTDVMFRTGGPLEIRCALTPERPQVKAGDTITVQARNGTRDTRGTTLRSCQYVP
jgi:hypothetical protein